MTIDYIDAEAGMVERAASRGEAHARTPDVVLGTDASGRAVSVQHLDDVTDADWVLDDAQTLWIAFRLAREPGCRFVRVSHLTADGERAAIASPR